MFPNRFSIPRMAVRHLLVAGLSVGLVAAGAGGAAADNGKGKGKSEIKKSDNSRPNSNEDHDDDGDHGHNPRTPSCKSDWAAASANRPPALRSKGAAGIYVWHDGGQWNVYATHTDRNLVTFQGSVRFDAPTASDGKSLGRGSDVLQRSTSGVDFTFKNYGDLDGVRFKSSCASTITVSALINGQPSPIFVGRNATPVVGTFTEKRVVSPTVSSTLPTVAPTTTPTTTTPACTVPAWNPSYLGSPSNLRRGSSAGLYVWLDGDRLRVETTRPNNTPSVITGVIAVNAAVLSVKGSNLDGGNDVITPALNGATFSFSNTGGIDGLELRSPCATQIVISATIDGVPVVPQQIWIGRNAVNPSASPIVLNR